MIILNFKTYPQASGKNCVEVISELEQYFKESPEYRQHTYIAPPIFDLHRIVTEFPEINVISQSTDPLDSGSTTGWVPAESVLDLGVNMTLLNHSEHRIEKSKLKDTINFVQNKGLKVIVCCENTDEASQLLDIKPYAIAYEPKELIGSGRSVSNEKPEVVEDFIKACSNKTMPLIGAGVSTGEDIKKGLELGAKGFLIASAFTKAEDKVAKLKEFVDPLLRHIKN